MEGSYETFYIERVWLNEPGSPSTADAVFYDGKENDGKETYESKWFKLSDCYHTVRLHKAFYDTNEEYIAKLKRLKSSLEKYISHLENNTDK